MCLTGFVLIRSCHRPFVIIAVPCCMVFFDKVSDATVSKIFHENDRLVYMYILFTLMHLKFKFHHDSNLNLYHEFCKI